MNNANPALAVPRVNLRATAAPLATPARLAAMTLLALIAYYFVGIRPGCGVGVRFRHPHPRVRPRRPSPAGVPMPLSDRNAFCCPLSRSRCGGRASWPSPSAG